MDGLPDRRAVHAAHSYSDTTPRGIIVQDTGGNPISAISVPEGGEASYQVLLTAPPTEDVEVCVALFVRDNDDSDITFKGQAADVVSIKLTFTSENWNTAQTVTLVAAEDDTDDVNGARDVTHDAREYYSGKVDITATEIDNDEITLPDAPADLTATASDGSITLSWDDPSNSSITGYEYNVNHNDTSSGNLSGWGPWTAIAGSECMPPHPTPSPDSRTDVNIVTIVRAVNSRGQQHGRSERGAMVRIRHAPRIRLQPGRRQPVRRPGRRLPRHLLERRRRGNALRHPR